MTKNVEEIGKKVQQDSLKVIKEHQSSTNAIGQISDLIDQIQRGTAKIPDKSLKNFTNFMSNRGALRTFQQKSGNLTDAECRYCGLESENCVHLLTTCPAIIPARARNLGENYLHPANISKNKPSNIINFIDEIGVMEYEREE